MELDFSNTVDFTPPREEMQIFYILSSYVLVGAQQRKKECMWWT